MASPLDLFLERYGAALKLAAQLEAEVVDLEHARKMVLAVALKDRFDLPEWKADAAARADERYALHLAELATKRREANAAAAESEYLRARFETWRSTEATKRSQPRGD